MKLSAAHQPSCYVGRLQQRALGRKMGSQIPRDGNKDMTALVAVAPLVKLPYPCLEECIECAVLLKGLPGWRGVELHDIEIVGFHPRKTLFDSSHDIIAREDVCPSLAARCQGCAHQTAAFAGQIIFGGPMRDIAANPLLAQPVIDRGVDVIRSAPRSRPAAENSLQTSGRSRFPRS
jgi:hypothetical protein